MTRLTLAGLVVAQHSPVGLPMVHSTLARPEEGVDTWVFWQACACGCDGMHVHANTYKHGTMDPINIDTGSTYFPRELLTSSARSDPGVFCFQEGRESVDSQHG